MGGYRQFHTKFWKDEWLIELEPLERYLFTYLFTNDLSSISGIFKLPMRVIINETGLDKPFIEKTLAKFEQHEKIMYRDGVMWVVKMHSYHKNASPKTMTKVYADVAEIGACDVKTCYEYYQETGIYSTDTVYILNQRRLNKSSIERENKKESTSDAPPPPNVFQVYESEIGALTAIISDDLQMAERDYSPEWVIAAIQEAAKNNKRSWAYALAILKRCKAEGKSPGTKDKEKQGTNGNGYRKQVDKLVDADGNTTIIYSDGTQEFTPCQK